MGAARRLTRSIYACTDSIAPNHDVKQPLARSPSGVAKNMKPWTLCRKILQFAGAKKVRRTSRNPFLSCVTQFARSVSPNKVKPWTPCRFGQRTIALRAYRPVGALLLVGLALGGGGGGPPGLKTRATPVPLIANQHGMMRF